MFTGIVEEQGTVREFARAGDAARLAVAARVVVDGVEPGDSIAVDGCCVTVTAVDAQHFEVDLMAESLRVTTLGRLREGEVVNLERAMRLDGRLGGHLVQGHVDGIGVVRQVEDQPGTRWMEIEIPAALRHLVVEKGSLAVDGVSLTVAAVTGEGVRIGVIPHTAQATTLGNREIGDVVNIEADVIAKHVAQLLAAGQDTPYRGLTVRSHVEHG